MSIIVLPYTRGNKIEAELLEPVQDGAAKIRITVVHVGKRFERRQSCDYWLEEVTAAWGRSFILTKVEMPAPGTEDAIYQLVVSYPWDSFCGCKGFESNGYCKHLESCRALMNEGVV